MPPIPQLGLGTFHMPLAYGKVIDDATIIRIARERDATPAQVALAWSMAKGYAVIPSSTRRANLESNLRARDVVLTPQDIATIDALEPGRTPRRSRLRAALGLRG
ncbi:aldo/keto reductase [Telluria antibiotica]|uniref:aldo/keto reductase n=1 Tax=Telluria antibiotica TaxID=2717319 RepID=UPI001AAF9768|nr:aldo/keto reductase [Telluria antibiotica]